MRIVLLGHPRSGTNSLVQILQSQPGVQLVNEPFCDEYARWDPKNDDYLARLAAGESFDTIIDELFAKVSGIKELSYQLTDDRLHRLAHRDNVKVITLRRANLLEAAVSFVLAEKTGLWKSWDAESPVDQRFGTPYPAVLADSAETAAATKPLDQLGEHYRNLQPLDVDLVRERIAWMASEIARIDAAVTGLDALRLTYENIYLVGRDRQVELIKELWDFLGLPGVESTRIDFFLSDTVRQASHHTYGRVPNITEIDSALGSNQTGHLHYS